MYTTYPEYQRRVAFLVEEMLSDTNDAPCVCRAIVEDLSIGKLIEYGFVSRLHPSNISVDVASAINKKETCIQLCRSTRREV